LSSRRRQHFRRRSIWISSEGALRRQREKQTARGSRQKLSLCEEGNRLLSGGRLAAKGEGGLAAQGRFWPGQVVGTQKARAGAKCHFATAMLLFRL